MDRAQRAPLRLDTLAERLAQPLDDELAIVQLLVASLARNQLRPELWALLHEAAVRDGRQAELGAAYAAVEADRRYAKMQVPSLELWMMAASSFAADYLGDVPRARACLGRLLAAAPTHEGALERLEQLVVEAGDLAAAFEVYATAAAAAADRAQQRALLLRAVDYAEQAAGPSEDGPLAPVEERMIAAYQQLAKLDPSDERAARALEALLRRGGRTTELGKLLEARVATRAADPSASPDDVCDLREELLTILQGGDMAELERAVGHVEAALSARAHSEPARRAAERLLESRTVAVRAGLALADALSELGRPAEVADVLGAIVEHARGPKRVEIQHRLAVLRVEVLGDAAGAYAVFEALVQQDPNDAASRQRVLELASAVGKRPEAIKVLSRAAAAAREGDARAAAQLDFASLVVEQAGELEPSAARAELKRAGAALLSALASTATDVSSRAGFLAYEVAEQLEDLSLANAALDRLAAVVPPSPDRWPVLLLLARRELAPGGRPEAVSACVNELLAAPLDEANLASLHELVENGGGGPRELAQVLKLEMANAVSPDARRSLGHRRIALILPDAPAEEALAELQAFFAAFGDDAALRAHQADLLEGTGQWEELAQSLQSLVLLADAAERARVWARLGAVLLEKLSRPLDAARAYAEALTLAPDAPEPLAGLLRIARVDGERDAALMAAGALDTLASDDPARLQALEVRAALDEGEAASYALVGAAELRDALGSDGWRGERARGLAERGIVHALASAGSVRDWLVRFERSTADSLSLRGERLAALADSTPASELGSDDVLALADSAASALAETGAIPRAVGLLRRAIDAAPERADLVARVEDLLAASGSARERLALYEGLLARAEAGERRVAALHKLAALQAGDLAASEPSEGWLERALGTYAQLLTLAPADARARSARLALVADRPADLVAALQHELGCVAQSDQARVERELAEAHLRAGQPAAAVEVLSSSLARGVTEPFTLRLAADVGGLHSRSLELHALERAVDVATDAAARLAASEALRAAVARDGDHDRGAELALAGAGLASEVGNDALAAKLYEEALAHPRTSERAAERLVARAEAANDHDRLAEALAAWTRSAREPASAVVRLERREELSESSELAATVLARTDLSPSQRFDAELVEARSLARRSGEVDAALARLWALLGRSDRADERAAQALDAVLAHHPERLDERERLARARVEHASGPAQGAARRSLAAFLLEAKGDGEAAERVLADAIAADPTDTLALGQRARLLQSMGRAGAAIEALRAHANGLRGDARAEVLAQLAALCVGEGRVEEALSGLEELLGAATSPPPEAKAVASSLLGMPKAHGAVASALEAWALARVPGPGAEVLGWLLDAPALDDEVRARRASLWGHRVAALEEHGSAGDRLAVALRAAVEVGSNLTLWDAAERWSHDAHREADVVAAYQAALAAARPGEAHVGELAERAHSFFEEWSGDSLVGAALLRTIVALEVDEDGPGPWFDRLVLALSAREAWAELFELYDWVIECVRDDGRRADLLRDASELARDMAGSPERSARYLWALVHLRPDPKLLASLERMLEKQGQLADLVELLREQVPGARALAAARLHVRIASLLVRLDGRLPEALDHLEAGLAVAEQPAERAELHALAERALELGEPLADPHAPRVRAARLLLPHYRATHAWERLARALVVSLSASDVAPHAGMGRAALLRDLVDAHRAAGDESSELEALFELVSEVPTDREARALAHERAAARGKLSSLAEVLVASVARVPEQADACELYDAAAILWEGDEAHALRALDVRAAQAERASGEPRLRLDAMRSLERVLRRFERWEAVCDALEELSATAPDASEQRHALAEVARIASDLGQHRRSLAALAAEEALVPSRDVIDRRVEVLRRASVASSELPKNEVLAALASELVRRADQVDLREAAGLRESLGDLAGAVDAWAAYADAFGREPEPTMVVASLLERLGERESLVAHLEASAAASELSAIRPDLLRRAADARSARGGDEASAIEAYERAIASGDSSSVAALESFAERLAERGESALVELASAALLRVYEASATLGEAMRLVHVRMRAARDDAARAQIGSSTVERLAPIAFDSAEGAQLRAPVVELSLRSLSLDPSAERAERALSLSLQLASVPALAELLRLLHRARPFAPRRSLELLRPLAEALALLPDGAPLARDAVALALTTDAEPARAHRLAADVEQLIGDLDRRLDALEAIADHDVPGLDALREAAELALERGHARAVHLLTRLFDAAHEAALTEPGDASASVAQAAWAADQLFASPATPSTERARVGCAAAELPLDPSTRIRYLFVAAEVSPLEPAIGLYERILGEGGHDERAAEPLAALYSAAVRPEELATLTSARLRHATDRAARVAFASSLANQLEGLGRAQEAEATLRDTIRSDGPNELLTSQLVALLAAAARRDDVVVAWASHAEALEAIGLRAEAGAAFVRAGKAALDEPADTSAARRYLEAAVALGCPDATDPLARLLMTLGAAREAVPHLASLFAHGSHDALEEYGLLYSQALLLAGDFDRADGVLEQLLAVGLGGAEAVDRLLALHRPRAAAPRLAELLSLRADLEPAPSARAGLLAEAGKVWLDVKRPADAVTALSAAVEAAPDDVALRLAREGALLEAGEVELAREHLEALLGTLGQRRPRDRALVHFALSRACLARGDREGAVAQLELALKADPTQVDSHLALGRVSVELGQLAKAQRAYRGLLLVLRKPSGEGRAPISRAEVLLELSELATLEGETERAWEQLESAFEAAATAGERSALHAALRRRGRHEASVRALEVDLARATDDDERAALREELAVAELAAGLTDRAAPRLLESLAASPLEGPLASERLARGLEAARGTGREADFVASAVAALALGFDRAGLQALLAMASGLEPARALASAVADAAERGGVLDVAAAALELLATLDRADGRSKDELARLRQRRALGTPTSADLLYRVAELELAQEHGLEAGLDALEAACALDLRPSEGARLLLSAMQNAPSSERAVALLESLARESGDSALRCEALWARLTLAPDRGLLDELVALVGSVEALGSHEPRLRSLVTTVQDGAFAAEVWTLVARVRAAANDAEGEAHALDEAAASSPEPRPLLVRLAQVCQTSLGDLGRAAAALERAWRTEESSRELWEPLLGLLRALGDRSRTVKLLEAVSPYIDDPGERVSMLLERAEGAPDDEARGLLWQAFEEDPRRDDVVERLLSLLERTGGDELRRVLEAQLDRKRDEGDTSAVLALGTRLAALAEQSGDVAEALARHRSLLEWQPDSLAARRAIVRLLESSEPSLDLVEALERLLEVEEAQAAEEVALRLADVLLARDDLPGARSALELGLSRSKGERVRSKLGELYAASGDERGLASLAIAEAEALSDHPDTLDRRASLWLVAAERLQMLDAEQALSLALRAAQANPSRRAALDLSAGLAAAIGKPMEALVAFDAALSVSPGDVALLRQRADLRRAARLWNEAIDDLELAMTTAPEVLGELLAAHEERAAASPDHAAALVSERRLVQLHLGRGDTDAARARLSSLLSRAPTDAEALVALADLEEQGGAWDTAAQSLRQALPALAEAASRGEGLEPMVLVTARLADGFERAERLLEASSELEYAAAFAPADQRLLERLARARELAGDRGGLVDALCRLAQLSADDVAFELWLRAGKLVFEVDPARAVEPLSRARALQPGNDDATVLVAQAMAYAGQFDDTRALLTSAAAGKPRRSKGAAMLYRTLAWLERSQERWPETLEALGRAFDADPHDPDLALELGVLAFQLDDQATAAKALRPLLTMKVAKDEGEGIRLDQRGYAYYLLGELAHRQGDLKKAKQYAEKSLADDPNREEARALLERSKA